MMRLKYNPVAKLIVRIVAYSMIGWFFLVFNPFGIGDISDQATQDALYKIAAPYYHSQAQQDIVVVLLNQTSIAELYKREAIQANEWPIRYRDHAYLLSRIIKHRPKAIFFDIYFKQERSTDDSFAQFLRQADRLSRKYKVPLLFAGGYADEQLSDTQRKLNQAGERVVTGWEDYNRAYPLDDNGQLTAAYRLYQLACLNDSPLASCMKPVLDSADVAAGDAVSVRWGNRPGAVIFPEFTRSICADHSGSILEVGRQILYGFIVDLVSYDDSKAPVDAQCAYNPVVYADELVYVDKAGTEQQKQRLADALNNRVVMYALSLEGLHDDVYSPVHGLLPGVFFHAMTLDNLMHYGADYVHATDDWVERINQYIWVIMTLVFSLVLFYYERQGVSFSSDDDTDRAGNPERRISAWWLFVIASATILTISVSMFVFLRYEPFNSIGFLALIGVSSWLVSSNFAEWILEKITLPWRYARVCKRKFSQRRKIE